jgi:hypothetical protein
MRTLDKRREAEHMANNGSIFEAELQDVIPICHATIAGTRIVGRLTAGYDHVCRPMISLLILL